MAGLVVRRVSLSSVVSPHPLLPVDERLCCSAFAGVSVRLISSPLNGPVNGVMLDIVTVGDVMLHKV